MHCMEAGLVDQWKVRTWARMKTEDGDVSLKDDDVSTVVTLDHLQSAFYLYLLIILLATFTFCIEILCKWKGEKGEKGKNSVFQFTPHAWY